MIRAMRAATLVALAWGVVVPSAAQQQPAPEPAPPEAGQEQLVEDIVAWVNDDVILLSELVEGEQQLLASVLKDAGGVEPDEMAEKAAEVRQRVLFELIQNRLLVQQAERLYDLEAVKKDLIERFIERQGIKDEAELDRMLEQYGMTRADLEERLLMNAAPGYVVEAQVTNRIGVSEQDARAWYEAHRDRFATPAQVTFRELVLEAPTPEQRQARRAEVERIVEQARAGTPFEDLVEQYSEAPSRALGGKIGPVDPADLRPEIAAAVRALPVGEVSAPIETDSGWHVVVVLERSEEVVQPFEEVREICENEVRRERFGKAYDEYLSGLWNDSTIEVRAMYLDRLPEPWRSRVGVRGS